MYTRRKGNKVISIPDVVAFSVSLLLWRNFPRAWNRERVSSLPHDKEYPSSKQLELTKIPLEFDFRLKYCKDVIAFLISPPLDLAIASICSAFILSFSSLQILESIFVMEFAVIGLKATLKAPIFLKRCLKFFPTS